VTRNQTKKAPIGKEKYLLIPNNSMLAAQPENSAMVLPRFVMKRETITQKAILTT
jgi:hypothetical protein